MSWRVDNSSFSSQSYRGHGGGQGQRSGKFGRDESKFQGRGGNRQRENYGGRGNFNENGGRDAFGEKHIERNKSDNRDNRFSRKKSREFRATDNNRERNKFGQTGQDRGGRSWDSRPPQRLDTRYNSRSDNRTRNDMNTNRFDNMQSNTNSNVSMGFSTTTNSNRPRDLMTTDFGIPNNFGNMGMNSNDFGMMNQGFNNFGNNQSNMLGSAFNNNYGNMDQGYQSSSNMNSNNFNMFSNFNNMQAFNNNPAIRMNNYENMKLEANQGFQSSMNMGSNYNKRAQRNNNQDYQLRLDERLRQSSPDLRRLIRQRSRSPLRRISQDRSRSRHQETRKDRSSPRSRRRSPSPDRYRDNKESDSSKTVVAMELIKTLMDRASPSFIDKLSNHLTDKYKEDKEMVNTREIRGRSIERRRKSSKRRRDSRDDGNSDLRSHLNLKKRLGSTSTSLRSRLDRPTSKVKRRSISGKRSNPMTYNYITGVVDWIVLSKMKWLLHEKDGSQSKISKIFDLLPETIPVEALQCIACKQSDFISHKKFIDHISSKKHNNIMEHYRDMKEAVADTRLYTSQLFCKTEVYKAKREPFLSIKTVYCNSCETDVLVPRLDHIASEYHNIILQSNWCCNSFEYSENHKLSIPHLLSLHKKKKDEIKTEADDKKDDCDLKIKQLEDELVSYTANIMFSPKFIDVARKIKCSPCDKLLCQSDLEDHCKSKDHYDRCVKHQSLLKKKKDAKNEEGDVNVFLEDLETIDSWLVPEPAEASKDNEESKEEEGDNTDAKKEKDNDNVDEEDESDLENEEDHIVDEIGEYI